MPEGELERLRQRKKELLLESDINRQIVRVEVAQLQIKATEWRQRVLKVRTAYNWMAPMAGVGFALWGIRRKMKAHTTRTHHNGHGSGKAAYLNLLAPIGIAALRRAYSFWRHAKKRGAKQRYSEQ
jgi:hypothetical protein